MDETKKIPGSGNNPLNNKTPSTFNNDETRGQKSELKSKSPRIRSGHFDPSNRDPRASTAVSGAYPEKQIAKARSHADAIAEDHNEDDQDI